MDPADMEDVEDVEEEETGEDENSKGWYLNSALHWQFKESGMLLTVDYSFSFFLSFFWFV